MLDLVTVVINGRACQVPAGTTVAAAILISGVTCFRRSIHGEDRAPLCGIGVCMECRVTINHVPHSRSCQSLCVEGMEIFTDG